MDAETGAVSKWPERELLITRVFDAPRELVFKTWTEPEHLIRWRGPKGFTTTVISMDLRPGGAYRFHMRSFSAGRGRTSRAGHATKRWWR